MNKRERRKALRKQMENLTIFQWNRTRLACVFKKIGKLKRAQYVKRPKEQKGGLVPGGNFNDYVPVRL